MPVLNNHVIYAPNQFSADCDYNHKLMMVLFLDLYHQHFTLKK